jgi:hypothetical protein
MARIVSGARLALSDVTTSAALENTLSDGTLVAKNIKKLMIKIILNDNKNYKINRKIYLGFLNNPLPYLLDLETLLYVAIKY